MSSFASQNLSTVLEAIANKEASYKEHIKQNHILCKNAANSLSREGGLVEALNMMVKTEILSEQEVQTFLGEQRQRLKKLSESNVNSNHTVDTFVSSIRRLKQQVQNDRNPSSQQEDAENEEDFKNYEPIVRDMMDTEREKRKSTKTDLLQEKYVTEIYEELGEEAALPGRGSRNVNNDDDIEVMGNGRGAESQAASLMCPVICTLLENPMKNKVCGHIYSLAGLKHLLRNSRRCACPVAGCQNNNVTMEQVEEDVETQFKIRREKRRQDAAATQQQYSQADEDLVDDSEEECV